MGPEALSCSGDHRGFDDADRIQQCCASGCLSPAGCQASPCGNGCGQVRWRDENAEALAPDDRALIVLQIDAGWDRIALTALEGAQATEIDEHDVLQVRR